MPCVFSLQYLPSLSLWWQPTAQLLSVATRPRTSLWFALLRGQSQLPWWDAAFDSVGSLSPHNQICFTFILSFIYDDEKQLSGKGGEQCFHCRMKLGTLLDLKCLALSDKKIKREQSSHLMLQLKLWSAHSVTSVENVRGIRRQLYIWWNKNPLKRGFICHEWNKEEVHDTQIYMNDAHKVMVTSSHL